MSDFRISSKRITKCTTARPSIVGTLALLVLLAGCRDTSAPLASAPAVLNGQTRPALYAFDCTGSGSSGISCTPSAAVPGSPSTVSPSRGAAKILGTPFAALSQTTSDFGVSGPNQLRSTIALQNLTVQPFATDTDYVTYDSVGATVFFASGPTNTGGTPGPVTLVNPDGTNGTFTGSNQAFYTYAEQLPANATTVTPKQWIFQLPDATTTFSFQVYVSVALPDESTQLSTPSHSFVSLAQAPTGYVTCGVRTGGTGYCWGSNSYGQLGVGTTINASVAMGILGAGHSVTQLAQGGNDVCAVTTSGQLYCWGNNQYGQLGNTQNIGTGTANTTPLAVALPSGVTSFRSVAVGSTHTCAIANTTLVYCWGSNRYGALGVSTNVGNLTANPTPQLGPLPSGVSGFTAIAAGVNYTCAIANTGQVYCWGINQSGQLGTVTNTGTTTPTSALQAVPLPLGVTSFSTIATGSGQSCALANTAQLYCWGNNRYGQLGTSTNTTTSTPNPTPQAVAFPSGVTGFSAVSTGSSHTCGLTTTGSVYCWGYNVYGQLGTSTNMSTSAPTPTPQLVPLPGGVASFSTLAIAGYHTCGSANTGQVYCWGWNILGQFGNGATDPNGSPTPTAMLMP